MRRWLAGARDFARLVYQRSADDNIFFLASALTFDVLLAAIPFLLIVITVAGLFLAPQLHVPQSEVLDRLQELLPPFADPELERQFRETVEAVVERAGSIGALSGVAFVWLSARIFASLRIVLGRIFDRQEDPGVIRGKVVDVQLVFLCTILLCANVALTSFLGFLGREGMERLGIEAGFLEWALGFGTAFLFIYLMFLMIFKLLPMKRLRWRTAALAALLAAVAFELLKITLGWFFASYADYSSIFFAFAALAALVLSVYYGSVLVLLAGEMAHAADLRRTIRRQRERFHG